MTTIEVPKPDAPIKPTTLVIEVISPEVPEMSTDTSPTNIDDVMGRPTTQSIHIPLGLA